MKLFSCDCASRYEALQQRMDRLEASRKAQAQDFAELQDKVYRWMKRSDQRVQTARAETADAADETGRTEAGSRSAVEARIWARRHRLNGRTNGVPESVSG